MGEVNQTRFDEIMSELKAQTTTTGLDEAGQRSLHCLQYVNGETDDKPTFEVAVSGDNAGSGEGNGAGE